MARDAPLLHSLHEALGAERVLDPFGIREKPNEEKGEEKMGRGDQRTRRGKIWRGTTGKTRPKKKKKASDKK
jgi:30S ribosomal protein S31